MLILTAGDILSLTITSLLLFVIYIKWHLNYWQRKNVPSASPIYNLRMHKFYKDEDYKRFKENGVKFYGTHVCLRPTLIAVDVEFIKSILIKDYLSFNDRGFYANPKDDPLSYDFSRATGESWKNMRAIVTPAFTSSKMKSMFNIVYEMSEILVESMQENIIENRTIDAKELMSCFTTDIIGSSVFGLDFNSLKDPNSQFRYYGRQVFRPGKFLTMKRMFLKYYPSLGLRFGMAYLDQSVANFMLNVVRETIEFREKNNYRRDDFMQTLIDIKNNDKSLTVEDIAAQLFIFFAAGFEASSSILTFALYELSINKDIQRKVREELNDILKKYDNKFTYESLGEMIYLQQVIDETMRKYPSFYNILRRCCADYTIPDTNVVIEKGTMVAIPVLALHYDEEYYPDPNKFDPERFNKSNVQSRPQCVYMPFGEGPRICIGLRFGIMQTKIGLVQLLTKLEFTLDKQTKPFVFNLTSNVLCSGDPIYLNAKRLKP